MDVVQFNEVTTFNSVCSASDEILLGSSNMEWKVYQALIEKDGVGLVGSVTQLFTYPDNAAKVTSMTTFHGNLYFSSEGPQGGLFQANLDSKGVIRALANCEVHGIGLFNKGIAFSDPKIHQVKHYTCSAGVSILAGNGKKETGKRENQIR